MVLYKFATEASNVSRAQQWNLMTWCKHTGSVYFAYFYRLYKLKFWANAWITANSDKPGPGLVLLQYQCQRYIISKWL